MPEVDVEELDLKRQDTTPINIVGFGKDN